MANDVIDKLHDATERGRVAAQFFLLFGEDDTGRLAALLGLGGRQVERLRQGVNVPQRATALRMAAALDDARQHGMSSETERLERAERLRAQNEAKHRQTRVVIVDGLEEKEIPLWYQNVRADLADEHWTPAMGRLLERYTDPEDWARVPERTRAYALLDLGVTIHKTGRYVEAKQFIGEAIASRQNRAVARPNNAELVSLEYFMAVAKSNLGCSFMQLGDFAAAEPLFSEAIECKRDYGPAYYNLVCSASLARNEGHVAMAAGAMLNAAAAFFTPSAMEEIVRDGEVDKDLVFARQMAIYGEVMRQMRELALRRRAGALKPPVALQEF